MATDDADGYAIAQLADALHEAERERDALRAALQALLDGSVNHERWLSVDGTFAAFRAARAVAVAVLTGQEPT